MFSNVGAEKGVMGRRYIEMQEQLRTASSGVRSCQFSRGGLEAWIGMPLGCGDFFVRSSGVVVAGLGGG
jgi:hypothetical protein